MLPSLFKEHILFLEDTDHEAAVGCTGGVHRVTIAPHIVAGSSGSIIIHQTAFEHERLFDAAAPVFQQACTRFHAKNRCERCAVRVTPEHFHFDSRKPRRLPGEAGHFDVVRAGFGIDHLHNMSLDLIGNPSCLTSWRAADEGHYIGQVLRCEILLQTVWHEGLARVGLTSSPKIGPEKVRESIRAVGPERILSDEAETSYGGPDYLEAAKG